MKRMTFDVKGMHCPSCEVLVKDSLEEAGGVKTAEVSHKEEKVTVEFDESKTTSETIRKIIRNEGFEVD